MSEFYARYIPPSTSQTASQARSEPASLKRPNVTKPPRNTKKRKTEDTRDGSEVLSKYSVTGATRENDVITKPRKRSHKHGTLDNQTQTQPEEQSSTATQVHAVNTSATTTNEDADTNEQDVSTKHSKVLSRFSKSRDKAAQNRETLNNSTTSDIHPDRIKLHNLAPLPQPKAVVNETVQPSYSTVPEWLQAPLKADQNATKTFEKLQLHKVLRENLKNHGKTVALPVQAAVLPLLLDKPVENRPDLCIAAATGSGKTFAYLLPILDTLRDQHILRLHAVVIVPTRALVKQVVQTLKSCSAGLGLKIGTAEGSKPLAEERQQLVEEMWIYNPAEYTKQKEAAPDWGAFSLDDLLDDAEKHDFLDKVGHVREYRSKVNILVCTPGRLVEHLQTTKGFNLDYVQWFVVDEADRLLNESYHEWLDAVLPALKSQKATEKVDQLLKQMRMDIPKRRVTKIMLSATMTNDISQLLALELTNPKMVVVEDAKTVLDAGEPTQVNGDNGYQLPTRLHESAIAFKDSENKPLYLIELLNTHIFTNQTADQKPVEGVSNNSKDKIDTSSDESSISSDSSDSTDSDATSSSGSSSSDEDDNFSISSRSDSSVSSSSISSRSASPLPSKPKSSIDTKSDTHPKKSERSQPRVLIFTKSTESAHRLSRLLCILEPSLAPIINTFTRSPTTSGTPNDKNKIKSFLRTRNKILASFTNGQTRILVSTDLAARGLDIPNLENVVNYDVPASALTYVHRVGRTARAGQEGQAWTLVEHKQGKWFWETIGDKVGKDGDGKNTIKRGDKSIRKVNLSVDKEKWEGRYEEALKRLGEDVRGQ